jgi:hypothetical protein
MMKTSILTASVLALPRLALACPVCVGITDAPLARATTIGVGVMLGVVGVVMAGFAMFFVRLWRRAAACGEPTC